LWIVFGSEKKQVLYSYCLFLIVGTRDGVCFNSVYLTYSFSSIVTRVILFMIRGKQLDVVSDFSFMSLALCRQEILADRSRNLVFTVCQKILSHVQSQATSSSLSPHMPSCSYYYSSSSSSSCCTSSSSVVYHPSPSLS
jgi:hypothetical protein